MEIISLRMLTFHFWELCYEWQEIIKPKSEPNIYIKASSLMIYLDSFLSSDSAHWQHITFTNHIILSTAHLFVSKAFSQQHLKAPSLNPSIFLASIHSIPSLMEWNTQALKHHSQTFPFYFSTLSTHVMSAKHGHQHM